MSELVLDYAGIVAMTDHLGDMVEDIDYSGVVGINRGGLPVAVPLSHRLEVPMGVLSTRSYSDREQDDLDYHGVIVDHLDPEKVLVVDDVVHTGATMEVADAMLTEQGFEVETAALHVKPPREFDPDYWISETTDWVVYPWEVSG